MTDEAEPVSPDEADCKSTNNDRIDVKATIALENRLANLSASDLRQDGEGDASSSSSESENDVTPKAGEAKELILSSLSSPDGGIRYHAIQAAGRCGISEACATILGYLMDSDTSREGNSECDNPDIAIAAIKASSKLAEQGQWVGNIDTLLIALVNLTTYGKDGNGAHARVRYAAVKVCGNLFEILKKSKRGGGGGKGGRITKKKQQIRKGRKGGIASNNGSAEVKAAQAIVRRLLDDDADVRIAAIASIAKLGSKTQAVAMEEAIELFIRYPGQGALGGTLFVFSETLERLATDEEAYGEDVRDAARRELQKAEGNEQDEISPSDESTTYEERIQRAKRRLRPRTSSWNSMNWGESRELPYYMDAKDIRDCIKRVDCDKVSSDEWTERGLGLMPQVIKGITSRWKAKAWTAQLLQDKWGEKHFRVGSDEDDEDVRLSLTDFVRYLDNDCDEDDNPMYLFDHIGEGSLECVLDEYSIPRYFSPPRDLFSVLSSTEERPPYRWVLFGGRRSGSAIHTDPLCTSAWNTSLFGRKRWMLFPPNARKVHLMPVSVEEIWPARIAGPSAWFERMLPRIRSSEWRGPKPVEILQEAGETVYVPAGWWHIVLNLDPCVAVTQNIGALHDYGKIEAVVQRKRSDIYEDWIDRVRQCWPDMAKY